jgi:catechol 2,3-dioxygenase-like lactoylglutathione lyase family enzyme
MSVTSLKHVALTVPDPAVGRDFYQAFGLEAQERGDKVAMRCFGRDQDQIVMLEGPEKRLHHYAFTATEEGVASVVERLKARGIDFFTEAPEGADNGGIWFKDFEGMWVNVVDMAPAEPVSYEDLPEPNVGRYRRVDVPAWRSAPKEPRPRRLGHSLMFTSSVPDAQEFYGDVLGLRLSDRIMVQPPGAPAPFPVVAFMNVGAGDHHVFGFVQSDRRAFHHASFEVSGIDEMAIGKDKLESAGAKMCFGLGRHALGSNLFHYTRDPWGSWVEYFADIDQITPAWQATDWDETEAPVAMWGPPQPEEFFQNHEAAPKG